MKNLNFILLLLLINFGSLISQNDAKWEGLVNEEYTIRYPSDWFLSEKGEMGTKFFLFTKLESGNDMFSENINLMIQDLTSYSGMTLEKFTDISIRQIDNMITNYKIIENKLVKTEQSEYQKIIYTGDQGKLKLRFVQYYFISKDKAYILTFTSEINKYKFYSTIADKILNSFKIID